MKQGIEELDIEEKKVIIRCDFNVPIKDGVIIDDTRIKESLKTINYAINKNAKVIILSHLGRIKTEEDKQKNTLYPVALRLEEYLNKNITFIKQTRGKELEQAVDNMNPGDVLLIENTRYEDLEGKKESSCDEELGKYWASLGDFFINDAFGTIHRSHASNVGIGTHLPSGIGFLVEKELDNLSQLENPNRPYYVILGGSKVSDKIGVITNLIKKSDKLIIGGAMAFTFLKSKGYEVGNSIVDNDSIEFCKDILLKYEDKIILPVDVVSSKEFADNKPCETKLVDKIETDDIGLDIGPDTINVIEKELAVAKTVVWNGPLGYSEYKNFEQGTKRVLEFLTRHNVTTILGGGDIVAAATRFGYKDKVTHASTGGGATLEYLEGKKLPGLEIIQNSNKE